MQGSQPPVDSGRPGAQLHHHVAAVVLAVHRGQEGGGEGLAVGLGEPLGKVPKGPEDLWQVATG